MEESSRRAKGEGAENHITEALASLARVLRQLNTPAAIIGGIAVISWGFGRSTADIDAAIAASPDETSELLKRFGAGGFALRIPDAEQFAKDNLVMLLRHRRTGVDVDVSLAQLPFERDALQYATRRKFGTVSIPVPSVSALIVYKMVAARPRDIQDVEELLARHSALVDDAYVESTLKDFDALLELDRAEQWRAVRMAGRRARK